MNDSPPTFTNRVITMARFKWNGDPRHFINWDTLVFQAHRNEGTAMEEYTKAISEAEEIILAEDKRRQEESEKPPTEYTIWKYSIDLKGLTQEGHYEIAIPKGAEILKIQSDGDLFIFIWARVNPVREKVVRQFTVVGTGQTVPETGRYIDTVFLSPIVLHVFETYKP